MYSYIAGITDTDNIYYCPRCGRRVKDFKRGGIAQCEKCGFQFGVVEWEEEE